MDDQKKTTNLQPNEALFVENSGVHRGHLGRWSSLVILAVTVFALHGVVFSTLDEVAPIDGVLATNEITIVIEPVSIPLQIMADAR